TSHAVAIAGTAFNALRVTRTGALSHWKGLAAPFTAAGALDAGFLAGRGVTGPLEVFEGVKGLQEALAGTFAVDWSTDDLACVTGTALKRFNAEIHSQAAIETALALRHEHGFTGSDVTEVAIETFQVAYDIIGGGREGDKTVVRTKEQADHSLPYLVAVALLDGEVLPSQFAPERIESADVQALLTRVAIRPASDLTARFPELQPCRMRIRLTDGTDVTREQADYRGWPTRPMSSDDVERKFDLLTAAHASDRIRADLLSAIAELEHIDVAEVARLLHDVGVPPSHIAPGR
ncbi:MAG: MmgE/PrpD family protein, partial [Acidimicrobiales bacterium]